MDQSTKQISGELVNALRHRVGELENLLAVIGRAAGRIRRFATNAQLEQLLALLHAAQRMLPHRPLHLATLGEEHPRLMGHAPLARSPEDVRLARDILVSHLMGHVPRLPASLSGQALANHADVLCWLLGDPDNPTFAVNLAELEESAHAAGYVLRPAPAGSPLREEYHRPSDGSERSRFVKAIQDQPLDASLHDTFADWLEEHGEANAAEFQRRQSAALRRLQANEGRPP